MEQSKDNNKQANSAINLTGERLDVYYDSSYVNDGTDGRKPTEADKIYRMLNKNYETLSYIADNLDQFTQTFYPREVDTANLEENENTENNFTSQLVKRLEIQGKKLQQLKEITDHLRKFV